MFKIVGDLLILLFWTVFLRRWIVGESVLSLGVVFRFVCGAMVWLLGVFAFL